MAFEVGKKEWQLAVTSGFGVAPWVRSVSSGDWRAVERVLTRGRARCGVPPSASSELPGRKNQQLVDFARREVHRRSYAFDRRESKEPERRRFGAPMTRHQQKCLNSGRRGAATPQRRLYRSDIQVWRLDSSY